MTKLWDINDNIYDLQPDMPLQLMAIHDLSSPNKEETLEWVLSTAGHLKITCSMMFFCSEEDPDHLETIPSQTVVEGWKYAKSIQDRVKSGKPEYSGKGDYEDDAEPLMDKSTWDKFTHDLTWRFRAKPVELW